MRTAIATDAAVKFRVKLLKVLLMVWFLQAALAAVAQSVTLITPTNHTWRYFTNGTDPGAEWALPAYDDSSWPQGRGLFGNDGAVYAPLGFNTPILSPILSGSITVYFRTHFTWNGSPFGITLAGTNYVDDGCVVYLNGFEVTRFNMPPGQPAFDTRAPAANPTGEPVRVQMFLPLDSLTNGNPNPLVNGDNVLAVEVHQNAPTSSDVVFGMSLFTAPDFPCNTDGLQPTNRTVVEGRSTTFTVKVTCFPTPTFQWYRNLGFGEELIFGATSTNYTLTNATSGVDEGVYYCRLTNPSGTFDSRQAMLTILVDVDPPRFLSALVVGPGLHTFRLTTDEPLCGDGRPAPDGCGSDFKFQFNWQIVQSDDWSVELGVATNRMINPTTYEFITSLPRDPSKQYFIRVIEPWGEISDLFGNRIQPGSFAETYPTLVFVQGVAGYTGTQDTEIHSNATADTPLGAAALMLCDLDAAGVAQSLLRFDNIFGYATNRIPIWSSILSASLTFNQVDPGLRVNLHRMLVSWDQTTVTWNSLVDGVAADGVEAMIAVDATSPERAANGQIEIDVTASVQAWMDGQSNHGWVLLSTSTDGWAVNTSESGAATAPMLRVAYKSFVENCIPTFIVQPPAMLTVSEFHPFSISVSLSNACTTLQWTKDGVNIAGAHSATYSVASATPADAGTYRLRIINPDGTLTSSPCVVTVVPDQTRPRVIRVVSNANGTNITIVFNEAINSTSAQNTANYTLIPALAVTGAVLEINNMVTLTTAARSVGTAYSLRIADVTDTAATPNVMDPNPTVVNLTSASIITGSAWADQWLYNTNNLDAAPNWKNPGFTSGSNWGTGSGLFGTESSSAILAAAPAPIATPLAPNSVAPGDTLVTTYFRKTIDLPALPAGARYVIIHYTDDGFIAYLDGQVIHRFAMPAGPVSFTNRSSGIPNGGEATYRSFAFDATPGTHTLAVELHQAGVTSSDVLFGMEVRIVGGTSPALSISRSSFGDVNLNWNADGNWRLRSATNLSGPYLDVAIPIGNRMGIYTLPSASVINRSFWLLEYTGYP